MQQASQSQPGRVFSKERIKGVWRGKGRPFLRWRALLGGFLAFIGANLSYQAALWVARWGWPTAIIGLVLMGFSILCLWKGLRQIWISLSHLGVRGMLLMIFIPLIGAYLFIGNSLAAGLGWRGWIMVAQLMAQQSGERLATGLAPLRYVPDDVSLAFWGRGASTWLASGAQPESAPNLTSSTAPSAIAPQPTSVDLPEQTPSVEDLASIAIGAQARVVGTEGGTLRVRESPGTDSAIVTRFQPGTTLEVIAGPVEVDGVIWWRVRSGADEGWCSAAFLERIR